MRCAPSFHNKIFPSRLLAIMEYSVEDSSTFAINSLASRASRMTVLSKSLVLIESSRVFQTCAASNCFDVQKTAADGLALAWLARGSGCRHSFSLEAEVKREKPSTPNSARRQV